MSFLKSLFSAVLVLGTLAFIGIQVVGIVKDIKTKKALKKEADKVDIQSDKQD